MLMVQQLKALLVGVLILGQGGKDTTHLKILILTQMHLNTLIMRGLNCFWLNKFNRKSLATILQALELWNSLMRKKNRSLEKNSHSQRVSNIMYLMSQARMILRTLGKVTFCHH